jgi:hypothetical protein
MAYIRREMFITDKKIQNYFDRLMKDMVVELPPRLAQDIGRHKTIRKIRELDWNNPLIIIGNDRRCNISVIKIRVPLKITKEQNKYFFNL